MMAQPSTMTASPRIQPDMKAATRCNDVLNAVGSGDVLLMSVPPDSPEAFLRCLADCDQPDTSGQ